jgi:hypothetical protein
MSRGFRWFLGIVGGNLLLAMLGFALPFVVMMYLVGGWILFLARGFKEATFSLSGFATAAVALIVFVGVLNWLLNWFYVSWTARKAASQSPADIIVPQQTHWRFSWTLGITGLVILMFVAGTAMIGLTHQIVWVVTSKEPIVDTYFEAGYRVSSQNNLKQMWMGLANQHDKGKSLPPGGTVDASGRMLHGWQTYLLPEVEEKALFDRVDLSRPWNDAANAEVFKTRVSCYAYDNRRHDITTDDDGFAVSTYAGNVHVLGGTRRWKLDEITDGTSKTILVGEVNSQFKPWGSPTNWRDPQDGLNKSPSGFGGPWKGGVTNFVMADGSVHALHESINPVVLKALSTPAAGDEARGDF